MTKNQHKIDAVSEIRVDPQPSGLKAVFLVETNSSKEARELANMFSELELQVQVRQLCSGKIMAYAVQAHPSDSQLLDEIEDVLRQNYSFVVTQRSFDEVIYRILCELCKDTGSKLIPISRCNICGKIDPFPNTIVSFSDEEGSLVLERTYCAGCTSEASAASNKEFIISLLEADEGNFGKIDDSMLIKQPSKKQPIRFRVKPGTDEKIKTT